eukprot:807236-Rhodomonas_salina.1
MFGGARNGSSLRDSSSRHGSPATNGTLKHQHTAEDVARIKINSASLQDKPSEWSSRNGFLTSDTLTEHILRLPTLPTSETDRDKVSKWAQGHIRTAKSYVNLLVSCGKAYASSG